MAERVCPHGHEIPESDKFCPQCGLLAGAPRKPRPEYPRTSMFGVPPEPRPKGEIIHWWESRRWVYNVALILIGIVGFISYLLIAFRPPQPYIQIPEPFAIIVALLSVPFILIAANIFYTAGWLVELLIRKLTDGRSGRFGPVALAAGITFTVGVIWMPPVSTAVYYIGESSPEQVVESELVGNYILSTGFGVDELSIKEDGTYEEVYTVSADAEEFKEEWSGFRPGTAHKNEGIWVYQVTDRMPKLVPKDAIVSFFPSPVDPTAPPPTFDQEFWPHYEDGKIALDVGDPDGWIKFTKVSEP